MITLAANENNDIFIGGGGLLATRIDLDALAQCLETAIGAQRGEMVYAVDTGMPMMDTAFNNYDPQAFEAAAREIGRNMPGVIGLLAFDIARVDNALSYSAVVETIYGGAVISG